MTAFSITWDYRCPFARNATEHVLAGLAGGAEWEVDFVPFSLGQVHVAEGDPTVWDRPEVDSGLLALQVGTAVRDRDPRAFPAVHRDLFALRHDHGRDLRDRDALVQVLAAHDVDAAGVFTAIDQGEVLDIVRKEHEAAARDHEVWGVPTFILGERAAFVRLMDRPGNDGNHARSSIDRILALLADTPELNEFKHTSLNR